MGAYLMAFSGDPWEKKEYDCRVSRIPGGWYGIVNVRDVKRQRALMVSGDFGSEFSYWNQGQFRLVFSGQLRSTDAQAAQDCRDWCERQNVSGYMGPLLSGDGSYDGGRGFYFSSGN